MPCVRGVDISIIVQPEAQKVTEYPHPDAWLLTRPFSRNQAESALPRLPEPDESTSSSKVSVYIPSVSGTQFHIHYEINEQVNAPPYFFFKSYLNGSNIVNWGIDPNVQTCGSISKALYEPCDRWRYKQDGIVLKREGIESRSFYFVAGPEASAAADDGGLIEVHVFRAQGRRRKAPELNTYRSQVRYGIASPSEGLLECPEDAKYFDWALIDPKDAPYASFHFHYRAWAYLRQLNLVLEDVGLPDDDQCLKGHGQSPLAPVQVNDDGHGEDPSDDLKENGQTTESEHNSAWETTTSTRNSWSSQFVPGLFEKDSRGAFSTDFAIRQLPNAFDGGLVTRTLSLNSYSSSIKSSLLPFVEEESSNADEEEEEEEEFVPGWNMLEDMAGRRPLPALPKRKSQHNLRNMSLSVMSSSTETDTSGCDPLDTEVSESKSTGIDTESSKKTATEDKGYCACEPPEAKGDELASTTSLGLSEGEWMKSRSDAPADD